MTGPLRPTSRVFLSLLAAAFLAACSESGPFGGGSNGGGGSSGGSGSAPIPDLPGFDGVRDFDDTLTVDGVLRRYWVHLPANYEHERRKSIPILIVYHGAGEDGETMKLATGLDTLADLHGFVVAYPNAVAGTWAGTPEGNTAQRQGVEDVRFTRALIRNLVEEYAIIPDAAYATGFSRGGFFIQWMACQIDPPVRAIASVGATMAKEVADFCSLPGRLAPAPFPALLMHGDQDNSVPAGGAEGILSVAEAASVLVGLNECRGDPIVTFPPQDPSTQSIRIRRSLWSRCSNETRVQIDVVEGGTHKWYGAFDPGAPFRASEVVVDFLRTAGGL